MREREYLNRWDSFFFCHFFPFLFFPFRFFSLVIVSELTQEAKKTRQEEKDKKSYLQSRRTHIFFLCCVVFEYRHLGRYSLIHWILPTT